jgi:hypothetical protein
LFFSLLQYGVACIHCLIALVIHSHDPVIGSVSIEIKPTGNSSTYYATPASELIIWGIFLLFVCQVTALFSCVDAAQMRASLFPNSGLHRWKQQLMHASVFWLKKLKEVSCDQLRTGFFMSLDTPLPGYSRKMDVLSCPGGSPVVPRSHEAYCPGALERST